MSGSVSNIICVGQITLKFVNHTLIANNRGLLLFQSDNLANLLLWKTGLMWTPMLVFEILFIKELSLVLYTQEDSIPAKLFM